MNPPKCNEYDYINFLTAAPKVFSLSLCMVTEFKRDAVDKKKEYQGAVSENITFLMQEKSKPHSGVWMQEKISENQP